ncbi:MAG TPA: nuclear transport factor 2 family protein [Anaerolineales bacterium]|nr:nuclear transport factor 2 family protein [Anaerolineales bacterium]
MTKPEFERLMQTIADGWNEGNARKAAGCFAENTTYVEPPDKQLYHGRDELYEFFGGDQGTDIPMKMIWHHLAFNEAEQIGFGEYTFEMHGRYHGIVVVQVESDLIKHWREYQYRTDLDWEEFTSNSRF